MSVVCVDCLLYVWIVCCMCGLSVVCVGCLLYVWVVCSIPMHEPQEKLTFEPVVKNLA